MRCGAAACLMPKPMPAKPLRKLLADLLLWAMLPATFLGLYTLGLGRPSSAIAPHAIAVGVLWLAMATLRVGARLVLPARAARLVGAAVLGSATWLLALYYGAVLGGIASWGQVITWELIASYLAQASALADALALSLPAIVAAVGASAVAAWAVAWGLLGRIDWTADCLAHGHPAMLRTGTIAASALVLLLASQFPFASIGWTRAAEPFSLTVYPHYGSTVLQSHRIVLTPELAARNAREDDVRSTLGRERAVPRGNLVVIVVDALRPDHMGVYGYARDTTPWLSSQYAAGRLARVDGVRGVCAESACGLLGLFASRYLHELPTRPITLHQAVKAQGYRVQAILGGDHAKFYGLSALYEGMDHWVDGNTATLRPGERRYVNDDRLVLDEARALPPWDGTPTLLQFHLMSAHQLGRRETPEQPWSPARIYLPKVTTEKGPAVNWYDNGVRQTDAVIRQLLATLQGKGYLRDALVAVTADHGESLGEHGRFAHAHGVHDAVLRVPLLLLGYGNIVPPALAARPVSSQVDIAPTLLATLGIPAPASWSGVALTEPARSPRVWFQQGTDVGLIDTADPRAPILKYWVDTRTGVEQVYDLVADPSETNNRIAALSPERRRAFRLDTMQRTPGALGTAHGDRAH